MALTPREREVLELVAEGLSNAEIAARLCISNLTVRTFITYIFADLGVKCRVAAASVVWRQRLAIVVAERDELRQRWQDMERYAKLTAREYKGLCNGAR